MPIPVSTFEAPQGSGGTFEEYCNSLVLPSDQVECDTVAVPYSDLCLRRSKARAELILKLVVCGIVGFSLGIGEQVGMFTVRKPNGRQRLINVARRSNKYFWEFDDGFGTAFADMRCEFGMVMFSNHLILRVRFLPLSFQCMPDICSHFMV